MAIREWILLLSASVVVIGWFVNSYLNRKHEISKKRIDHRLETLKDYISFYIEATKSESLEGFNDVQVAFYLYGEKDEIDLVKQVADIVTTHPDNPKWLNLLGALNVLARDRLRKQLGLPIVPI